jgi:hypothetical protein
MALCKKPYVGLHGTGPCGQCSGCLTNRKQLWTHRIILESQAHERNSFITLTYNDENMPYNHQAIPTLKKRDLTLFIKRLRNTLPQKLRYYAVGEYGTNGSRGINPHYHVCLFGAGEEAAQAIQDSWVKEKNRNKHSSRSESLGHTLTGSLTPQSAAYVAGYVQKKTNYNKQMYHEYGIVPEYATMSQGIGKNAVKDIAKILEQYPEAMTDTGDVPYSLKHGKRQLPLGNYLREKLRHELDLDRTEEHYVDIVTGEISTKIKWHGKEKQKQIMETEMQVLRENPEIQTESGKLPEDAQVSVSEYLKWKNGQAIINFEKRQELFSKKRSTL